MEFVIISGLSGAGKSRTASFMEDMGFFCVDNLPVPLIPKFAELGLSGSSEYHRAALVTDVRAWSGFEGQLSQALEDLDRMGCPYQILFMDASDDVIIRRYKESRRSHPLAGERATLEQAIALERQRLEPLRQRSHVVLDTTQLPTAKLRDELRRLFVRGQDPGRGMEVSVTSFGFKHGIPREADLVFDVRFLPNPFYVPELRARTGLDEEVRNYAFSGGQGEEFLQKLEDLMAFLLPRYAQEGKTALIVGVGCTGGHHRSVAVAHELAGFIRGQGWSVTESHRDMGRN